MTKTYTQADADAAVAAAVEKAAGSAAMVRDAARELRERHSDMPKLADALRIKEETADDIWHSVRALIPTDALAEHDAKVRAEAYRRGVEFGMAGEETIRREVRADALRQAAEFVRSYTTKQHVASDIKAGIFPEQTPVREAMARDILALIEGEA